MIASNSEAFVAADRFHLVFIQHEVIVAALAASDHQLVVAFDVFILALLNVEMFVSENSLTLIAAVLRSDDLMAVAENPLFGIV